MNTAAPTLDEFSKNQPGHWTSYFYGASAMIKEQHKSLCKASVIDLSCAWSLAQCRTCKSRLAEVREMC